MNKEEFLNLSLNPNQIEKESLVFLEDVLDTFPYFQTAQVLQLKGLKKQRSFKYNNTLKKVAAYTTNRTVLFDFITANVLDFEKSSKLENSLINDIEVIDSKLIDSKILNHLDESSQTSLEENSEKEKISTQILEIGTPIDFTKSDEFSFSEWLDLTPAKEIIREKVPKSTLKTVKNKKNTKDSKLSKQVDLIEKFIVKRPRIQADKTQEIKDIAIDSVAENTMLMTETLARVYVEQKKYDKAITAFNILSLKYPEKSSFFADKIKAIKFLKNKS